MRLGALDPFLNSARAAAMLRWGSGLGAMIGAAALRFPFRTAVVDDRGAVAYWELDRTASTLAAHIREAVDEDRGAVGILCRNHRGFVVSYAAAERAGADVVLLSTALPPANLAEVVGSEAISMLVVDEEFLPAVHDAAVRVPVVIADGGGEQSIAQLTRRPRMSPVSRRPGQLVLLTSGTTGPPKGACRSGRLTGIEAMSVLAAVPYRVGDRYLIGPPLFHAWGLSQLMMAMGTGSTLHLQRRFDTATTLDAMSRYRFDVVAVVPLMLRRLLRDSSTMAGVQAPRMVLSSGNVLPGELAVRWMDRFGDALYNFYGSTETGLGTVAGPDDLRRAPGTVGRPPRGVAVGILDEQHMPVPAGRRGRVHLASTMQFEGYSDGSDRERTGTLMATGDLGFLDENGLLYVEGRVNDMIVTGGENVFPSRVEEVLDQHPWVEQSAVVGVEDEEFGQRVVAFVVPRSGTGGGVPELDEFARRRLAAFMVPREYLVVESLPMTTTGKVVRHRLEVLGHVERL